MYTNTNIKISGGCSQTATFALPAGRLAAKVALTIILRIKI